MLKVGSGWGVVCLLFFYDYCFRGFVFLVIGKNEAYFIGTCDFLTKKYLLFVNLFCIFARYYINIQLTSKYETFSNCVPCNRINI